jgi:hypothetical protein
MNWKELSNQAMKAMINGDENEAVRLWRCSINEIREYKPELTSDVADVFYYLGKALGDRDEFDESIPLLEEAENILSKIDPQGSKVNRFTYHLNTILIKAGRSDEAHARQKLAMGEERVAECLKGEKQDDLEIKAAIKAFQKQGFISDLGAKEFKRIKKILIDEQARANKDADDNDLHIFDVFWEYYCSGDDDRRKKDLCAIWEDEPRDYDTRTYENVETEAIIRIMELFDSMIGRQLYSRDEIITQVLEKRHHTDREERLFIIVQKDKRLALPLEYDNPPDIVYAYNFLLQQEQDPRRFVRHAGYDDREIVQFIQIDKAAKLYLAGAGRVFEDLNNDLDPHFKEPKLVTIR